MKNDGGPAFPRKGVKIAIPKELEDNPHIQQIEFFDDGMSLRDYFSAQALIALTPALMNKAIEIGRNISEQEVAINCYKYADAMLAERHKSDKTS